MEHTRADMAAMSRPPKPAAPAAKPQRSGPRSVTRLLNVLRLLAAADGGASLAQLSQMTQTPKTSLLALLRELVAAGYIVQREHGYALGPESFALGSAIVSQRKLAQVARPILQRLADESGETILLAEVSADSTHAIYIEKAESTQAVRFIANVGERRPLYASAGGRALLSFQNAEFRKAYLARTKLEPLNKKKVLTRVELQALIEQIRKTHLATTNEDVSEGVAGFASPVFAQNGEVVAALVIGAPVARGLRDAKLFSALVKKGASDLSRILGYVAAAEF